MANWLEGKYRTEATSHRPPMAYVIDGRTAAFITEETYRAKGYKPAFESLPTEDEYNAE
jgi:hypothetical protein